ncbi:hypothetical protein [Aquimarina aggregata]|uniref:hypothetical protein n=1 Tax=Aquimarina aggregata TaxID=1642818 RepID=UPI002491B2E8|nr:hypothetical protein [Aquimarina aggregata]
MEQLLKNAFKVQIEAKQGSNFEEFIDELFLLKYGAENYIPIRGTRDKGNDGTILTEKKILACYAPKKYNKSDFTFKVLGSDKKEGDFPKYVNNWKEQFCNWEMLVNHEVSPDQLSLIEELEGNTFIKGIKQILYIIENDFTNNQRRKLATFLGIGEYFRQDYILDIIQDLLDDSNRDDTIQFDKSDLTPPKEKIELNFNEEDWDGVNSEMILVMKDFITISNILSGYEDNEKDLIKRRIIEDYNKLGGDFKARLNSLTEGYTKQYSNLDDDGYRLNVRTILLYMFEQCLIGKKTSKE